MINSQILIPAAGFGTRAGNHNAKEILNHPVTKRPMIEKALLIAAALGIKAHVITRKEKTELLNYLNNFNVSIQFVTESQEWPDTLLQSEPYWKQSNIVILPDTNWLPNDTAEQMFKELENRYQYVYATFEVEDQSRWGTISTEKNLIWEKPKENQSDLRAWGLFGFRRESGKQLLEAHLASTLTGCEVHVDPLYGTEVKLDHFDDPTRKEMFK